MKIHFLRLINRKLALVSLGLLTVAAALAQASDHYTVHEWGTFTSVQGGDGGLLPWRPLQSSSLPGFVHDWYRPGLNVSPTLIPPGGKGGLTTLQRMETPVIYFYSDNTLQADVSVGFPPGLITEWYPHPTQIGPSAMPALTNASPATPPPPDGSLRESRVTWRHLTITPPGLAGPALSTQLPLDQHGSHYFAARETDSDYVQTDSSNPANGAGETEKFLFYRGAGSFKTPLQVSMEVPNRIVVGNTGVEKLSHLFYVRVQDGYGAFVKVEALSPGQTNWQAGWDSAGSGWKRYPLSQFQTAIGVQMEAALVGEGLFASEARAMVKTWRDSWFTEEGTRVLYLLPRSWTDGILPITLNPRPDQLVRVMVGRAEIISPDEQTKLLDDLTRAQHGDTAARREAGLAFKKLGRFAWPALGLALGPANTNAVALLGYQLLMETAQSPN
jgi:hypothetical protein